MASIDLGYMSIADLVWSKGFCYCEDAIADGEEKCSTCKSNLNPDQIVIPKQDVTVCYSYPLSHDFVNIHHTDNPAGFTRKEISEQIMKTYAQIYAEEDSDVGKPTEHIPGMMNRNTSEGRHGIWGHDIGDLQLHSMEEEENGVFSLGVDS